MNEYLALARGKKPEWIALWEKKEDPMIKAMQAQIRTLEGLTRKQDNANKSNSDNKDKHANITCRKCKKKGHIAKNCMKKRRNRNQRQQPIRTRTKERRLVRPPLSKFLQKITNLSPRRLATLTHGAVDVRGGPRVRSVI